MGEVGGGEAPAELPLNTEGEGDRQTHTHKTKLNKNKLGSRPWAFIGPGTSHLTF